MESIYIGNDHDEFIPSLYLIRERQFVTDATITANLKDSDENILDSISLTWQSDPADLFYYGAFPASVTSTLTEGATYHVDFAISAGGRTGFERRSYEAKYLS